MHQEKEIATATKMESAIRNVRDIDIQAPANTHEDAHRMVLRNDQSHRVRIQSPKNSYPRGSEPDVEELEDSSESTDYEDSSLIESFHTQLALQDGDEEAIN